MDIFGKWNCVLIPFKQRALQMSNEAQTPSGKVVMENGIIGKVFFFYEWITIMPLNTFFIRKTGAISFFKFSLNLYKCTFYKKNRGSETRTEERMMQNLYENHVSVCARETRYYIETISFKYLLKIISFQIIVLLCHNPLPFVLSVLVCNIRALMMFWMRTFNMT